MEDSPSQARRQVARAAGTVMIALVIGQLASLAQSILIADTFGTQHELDAFFLANRVSETLFYLLAAGALSSAFIPTFAAFLAKEDRKSAWRLASAVANLLILTVSLLAVLAAVFAPLIVRYALAPGLASNPYLFGLTIDLLRLQLVSVILFGLSGLLIAILNSHQVFFIPALTATMYRLGLIFGILVLVPFLGIYGLAWGVVIGAALSLLIQIPNLIKLKGTYTFTLDWKNTAVGEVLRLMGPRIFGVAIVQLNFWVNGWLASQMTEGSVSAVQYGFSFMLMAQAAIAQSVATAAMPTLSIQYALGKLDDIRSTLAASLRGVILISMPASIGLILLREPILAMIYQHGAFDAQSTQMVAWALLWYAAGLVFHSVYEILARAFYAMHDTKTPVLVGAGAMGVNILLSFSLSAWFERIGWMPHGGLALANSIATGLEATILFILMRRRLNGVQDKEVSAAFGHAGLASLGMALGLFLLMQIISLRSAALTVLGGVLVGGFIYGTIVWLLKVPEVRSLVLAVRKRIFR